MDAPLLELNGLACGYDGRVVLRDIDLAVHDGEFVCLLGPNGVGKTTLFKTMLGLLPAKAGAVRLHGRDIAGWPAVRRAREIGYVPQAHTPPFPFSVLDVVTMGRAAHLGPFAQPSRGDMAVAEDALGGLGILHLARRNYTAISGGERQLVLIARALAQRPAVLVMDEPTSNLDFGNQVTVLDHVRTLSEHVGLTVIMTTHDPNHALRHANRVAALDRRGALRVGTPAEIVTEDYLRETYGIVTRRVAIDNVGWLCLPLGQEKMTCTAC